VPDDVIAPSAALLAVPIIPEQAFDNISQLITRYPMIYNQYGLLDAVEASTGELAPRFTAISQAAIMMAVDNAVNQDRLQGYFAASPSLFPYLSMERYSIHGLVGPG